MGWKIEGRYFVSPHDGSHRIKRGDGGAVEVQEVEGRSALANPFAWAA